MTQACEREQGFRGILIVLLTTVALLTAASDTAAQIYEWGGDANNRHYTNSLDSIPEEALSSARLVVEEPTPREGGEVSTSNVDEGRDQPPASSREAGDPFASGWDLAFGVGWEAGHSMGVQEQSVYPTQPPTFVPESAPPVIVNVPRYDPSGLYYRSPYEGTVTVPFDGGRSRGLTVRQLQEQQRGG